MIEFSCHSENFGIMSIEDNFSFISKLGFHYIDVSSRSMIPQNRILENPVACAAKLMELSSRYHLHLAELFLSSVEVEGISVSPSEEETKNNNLFYKNFNTICQFAKKAGFQSIMGSVGSSLPDLSYDRSFENAAVVLHNQVNIAKDYGIEFHVEPSRKSLVNTPQKAIQMIQAVPELRYTLDFLHFQIQGIPLDEALALIPYSGHMHARQSKTGIGKCDFKDGEIDYEKIVQSLIKYKWNGVITMEFWNDPKKEMDNINPVEQNILMRYELKKLINQFGKEIYCLPENRSR